MSYPISDVTRRVVYTGSAGVGPYSFSFEVLANTDIQVYKNTTLLTLTTNYTVTINSNGTGSVTLVVAATGADTITIVGDRAIQRATDFVTGGDLFANTLNDEFDSLVIFAQQVDEKADRGLKAPVTDPTDVNMVLPVKASRKGKVLAFDSTSGDPVAGPALDAVTTVIAQSANINTVADNIASVNTVAGNTTNINTVAGVSSAVTTVAGISSNVTSVAGNASNINTVAGNNTNVTTVAGISANVTTVAGISANVTSVAGNSTNINAVAGNATNINAVNANKTNIDTVAGVSSNVTTVASNIASVNSAATNMAAIIDAPNQAAAAAASATAAAASAASGMYSAVQDKSANYTVVAGDAGDLIRVTTTSGAITITLPTISTVGDGFKVAIVKWTGDGNAVSVVRSSTNTINGATSYSISNQYSSATFVADLETGQWFAVAGLSGATTGSGNIVLANSPTLVTPVLGTPSSVTLTNGTGLPLATGVVGVTPEANGGTGTTTGYYGFKNRIINGAMVIDQRNAGASVTPASGAYTLDRFQAIASQASKFSVQQNAGSVTPPTGFRNYLGVTSLSAYTVGAAEVFGIVQKIEGFNTADLGWGTASAKTVTLSFQVYSSLTGTFGGSLQNSAQNRSYPFSYSVPVANTWTTISVAIAGETTGTWIGATNGIGIQLNFGLGCGSTFSGTAGAWASSDFRSATGATSVVGTNGATWYVTGCQLEVGSTATSFDYRPYGTELALCQRYYQSLTTTVPSSSANYVGYISSKVTMRTTPTFTAGSGFTMYTSDANGCTCYQTTGVAAQAVTMSAEL